MFNGGFEATTVSPWVLKNGTKDKIKCNKPGKEIAFSGACAFVFKGSVGKNSQLLQSPNVSTISQSAGETFDFSAYIKGGSTTKGKIKITVKYSNGDSAGKFNASILPTNGYEVILGSIELTDAVISLVKVQIKHQSTSGKAFIDDVSLRYTAGNGSRLIRLP